LKEKEKNKHDMELKSSLGRIYSCVYFWVGGGWGGG